MSDYQCGSNEKRWWIYRTVPGAWVVSAPVRAGLRSEVFPSHHEAVAHYVRHQRSLAATRFARMLAGGAE